MKRLLAALNPELVAFIIGLVAFTIGLYLIFPPAAFIGSGIVIMAISVFGGGEK
jgi:hypothetical protein